MLSEALPISRDAFVIPSYRQASLDTPFLRGRVPSVTVVRGLLASENGSHDLGFGAIVPSSHAGDPLFPEGRKPVCVLYLIISVSQIIQRFPRCHVQLGI